MAMRQFGKVKFKPKPKTPEEWHRVYLKHKIELPHVKKLKLSYGKKGPGQSSARYILLPLKKYFPQLITGGLPKPNFSLLCSHFILTNFVQFKSLWLKICLLITSTFLNWHLLTVG